MLLPLAAESYRRNVAHHTFLAKVNAPTKVPDPRLELTNFVEDWVRQELRSHFIETSYRVLRWEQLDARNYYVVRFRELDGVFDVGRGVKLLLEVKASASKSSLKSGLQQLRSAVQTAVHAYPNTIGLLVIAGLGEWFDIFGNAPIEPLDDYFNDMDVDLLEWPPRLPAGKTSGICVSLIPGSALHEWLPKESLG
jgi:hypothetical protein